MGHPSLRQLDIEITSRCNLRCKMCPQSDPNYRHSGNGYLSSQLFGRLSSNFEHVSRIHFSGIGEPLLHKEALSYVKQASTLAPNSSVSFVSNTQLITTEIASQIVDSGLTGLSVSFDGFDLERGHLHPEKTIEIIRLIQKIKKSKGSRTPYIGLATVVGKDNAHQLHSIIDLCGDLGVAYINFEGLRHVNNMSGWREYVEENAAHSNRSEIEPQFWDTVAHAYNKGIKVGNCCLGGILFERRTRCDWPNKELSIGLDGSVYACRFLYPLGFDAYETQLLDIFHDKSIRELRQRLVNRTYVHQCATCPVAEVREQDHFFLRQHLSMNEIEEFERLLLGNIFSEVYYRTAYPDIKESGMHPVVHYMKIGRMEGRKAVPDA
ncbi:radical SAM protein [Oceanidesulfovibrio marinus]|uniref:Radical SAM core domain-containing protein n=1 Tax=Oceanidesulfovibrio marinus TaxID=370038 RepID=A0A6P1ZKE8_9BACT|nr:radical SAM protein [Oceanidesulfovibrio marinus]TVM36066.1 hypothetical protein DQK91_05330 [Oceanidesulfovibrio marinus]